MSRFAAAIAGALLGAALAVLLLVVAERSFFPEVHEAAKQEKDFSFGELRWPCVVLAVGAPLGALVGWACGLWLARRREG